MKNMILAGLMACSLGVFAQRKIEKTIPVSGGQTISMDFEFAELIQLHTYDKKEILIRGEVSINHGENDEAFEIRSEVQDGKVVITAVLKDQDKIPRRIVIHRDDQDFFFKTDDMHHPDVVKFLAENNGAYQWTSGGIQRSIKLEVFVPQGVATTIETKFGTMEITDFNAPLVAKARHGGIDVKVKPSSLGELRAKTRHGEILTNLDIKFDVTPANRNDDFWTEIFKKVGGGYSYDLEATHGKIYLRKAAVQ
jgi:hypothetical protein